MVSKHIANILTFFYVFSTANSYQYDCTKAEYNRCIKIADPLIKDSNLVFPDNMEDINSVCKTWRRFIDCLQPYTDQCFSSEQRRQFNNAVRNSIDSVHEMCVNPEYQREYLIYAPCIKSTITDSKYCGLQYSLLVNQVAQGQDISRATLCCSHDRFKKCIERETRNSCDNGSSGGAASKFSTQIIEKALSFLQDECFNYIPSAGDCSDTDKKDNRQIDSLTSPSSSEVYPWSTIQETAINREQRTKIQPSKTTSAWLPSSTYLGSNNAPPGTDMLDSRTRPASYGRSNGWQDFKNTQSSTNTMHSNFPSSSPRPEWGTTSTWHVFNQQPGSLTGTSNSDSDVYKGFSLGRSTDFDGSSSTTWYPISSDQIDNEIVQPNQQGLIKPKNNGVVNTFTKFYTILTILLIIC